MINNTLVPPLGYGILPTMPVNRGEPTFPTQDRLSTLYDHAHRVGNSQPPSYAARIFAEGGAVCSVSRDDESGKSSPEWKHLFTSHPEQLLKSTVEELRAMEWHMDRHIRRDLPTRTDVPLEDLLYLQSEHPDEEIKKAAYGVLRKFADAFERYMAPERAQLQSRQGKDRWPRGTGIFDAQESDLRLCYGWVQNGWAKSFLLHLLNLSQRGRTESLSVRRLHQFAELGIPDAIKGLIVASVTNREALVALEDLVKRRHPPALDVFRSLTTDEIFDGWCGRKDKPQLSSDHALKLWVIAVRANNEAAREEMASKFNAAPELIKALKRLAEEGESWAAEALRSSEPHPDDGEWEHSEWVDVYGPGPVREALEILESYGNDWAKRVKQWMIEKGLI